MVCLTSRTCVACACRAISRVSFHTGTANTEPPPDDCNTTQHTAQHKHFTINHDTHTESIPLIASALPPLSSSVSVCVCSYGAYLCLILLLVLLS